MGTKRFSLPRPPSADYPLRRVTDVGRRDVRGAWAETLECGHPWHGSPAMGSREGAARRRCRVCFDEAYRREREAP